jgi:hypothetical protein
MIYFICKKQDENWSYIQNGYYFIEPTHLIKFNGEIKVLFKNYELFFSQNEGRTFEELTTGATPFQSLSKLKEQFRNNIRIPKHIFDSLFFI